MKVSNWGSECESEKDDDSAHICFMVQGDDPLEVSSESHLDNLSMDEIASFFKLFEEKYDLLKIKNKNLKKEKDFLSSKLNDVFE